LSYKISGLEPSQFRHLVGLSDDELAAHNAVRVTASADRGFPCRVSLEDARAGEALILLHHVSHDVATPYRSATPFSFARMPSNRHLMKTKRRRYSKDGARAARVWRRRKPENALLALPGEADSKICALFGDPPSPTSTPIMRPMAASCWIERA
jgi:hypothetical protein